MQFTKLNIAPYLSKSSRLFIFTALIAGIFSTNSAADNTGTVDFEGVVVSTPCNIAQSSLKQVIDF